MIISLNWLKKFTKVELSVEELAERIGERLVEIEGVEAIGPKYRDVVVVRVQTCENLEGSDHLHVTTIDDGGVVEGVERTEGGFVQVVCGAPNIATGQLVAWLPPKTIVPETYSDAEPFVLGSKPLRGVMSHGMIASARELDLYDDHSGILVIDKNVKPGTSFAELYELDDHLLDIENKSLTHRPDTFGIIGFAREIAGIQGLPFETPDWLSGVNATIKADGTVQVPGIHIDEPGLSERFQLVALSGDAEQAVSPILMQTYLARSGMRPVNALVDVSNYLMLLTGQPTHAYDYDKLRAVAGDDFTVHVRSAHQGETLELLDGKTITLDASDVVIAAGQTAVGLAGIMGGKSTATDHNTKTVLLEVATFDLYHMRASQMRHGIFSEAVTRYTKGVPAPLGRPVLVQAVAELVRSAGMRVSGAIVDEYPEAYTPLVVRVSERQINATLGTQFAAEDIAELLENVGFGVVFDELTAQVTVPYWRKDIHIPEDIIEEVGRLAGFDTINVTLPTRDFVATRPTERDAVRTRVRDLLVRGGASEVVTYSFVHGDMLRKAGQNPDNAYRITNSISPDLQYYRQSITPSLLSHIHANIKLGFAPFALFELNKVHQKSLGMTDENVPVELDVLGYVIAQVASAGGKVTSTYYAAKNALDFLLRQLSIAVRYEALTEETVVSLPFEPKRAAVVRSQKTGEVLGYVGEYKKSVQKNFKLNECTAGFELYLEALEGAVRESGLSYKALSRYPGSERDICFQVTAETQYAQVATRAEESLQKTGLLYSVEPLDLYQADGSATKNITIRVGVTSYEKTMTTEEVSQIIDTVIHDVTELTGGKVV